MVAGINIPTVTGVNGQTHADAAINSSLEHNQASQDLRDAVGGKTRKKRKSIKKSHKKTKSRRKSKAGKKRKKSGKRTHKRRNTKTRAKSIIKIGGTSDVSSASEIAIPTIDTPYTPTGAPGQTPDDISMQLAELGSQGNANAEFDTHAGGKKKRKKRQCKPDCKCIMCKKYTHTRKRK
jgi:hypothetical protein